MVTLAFFFPLYCTWYLGYLFWIWCSASIPGLNCKLCNTSVTSCLSLGVPLNPRSLPIKMSVLPSEYWNSKALVRIPKWHHSPGIKVSCSKYFMCEEFKCCQLFPKWFDVRLILDFLFLSTHTSWCTLENRKARVTLLFLQLDNSSLIFSFVCLAHKSSVTHLACADFHLIYLAYSLCIGGLTWDSVICLVFFQGRIQTSNECGKII